MRDQAVTEHHLISMPVTPGWQDIRDAVAQ